MPSAFEVLEEILEGHTPTEADLNRLRALQKEGLHLDFKSGQVLNAPKDAARTVREYVSAFANSEGGILVLGVEDKNKTVDGCTAPGSSTLEKWAADALSPLVSYLTPPPRIHEVKTASGKAVLLIAVSRQWRLVPIITAGKFMYYLRIGESTHAAYDYLVSDLLLGRRQHPVLTHSITLTHTTNAAVDSGYYSFTVALKVENAGFATANNLAAGLVCWGALKRFPVVGANVVSSLDVVQPTGEFESALQLHHVQIDPFLPHQPTIRALGSEEYRLLDLWLPYRRNGQSTFVGRHQMGLYLLAEGSPPDWYQIEIDVIENRANDVRARLAPTLRSARPTISFTHLVPSQWS